MDIKLLSNILETAMIISFGISWPLSIIRSLRARSAKGKSLLFMLFICFGYFCGIAAKTIKGDFNLAYYFYYLNVTMVMIDVALCFRNRKLDREAAEAAKENK